MRGDCRKRAAARRKRLAKRKKQLGRNLFKGSRLGYLANKFKNFKKYC